MKNWYVGISDIPLHMALLKAKRKPKMLFNFDKEVNKIQSNSKKVRKPRKRE